MATLPRWGRPVPFGMIHDRGGAPRVGSRTTASRALIVAVLGATVAACSAAGGREPMTTPTTTPTMTAHVSMSVAPTSPPATVASTVVVQPSVSTTRPSPPDSTEPEVPPATEVVGPPVALTRTSLSAREGLGSESSLFSLVPAPEGGTFVVGAERVDDVPTASIRVVDPDTGATVRHWELPSPQGAAATARDIVVLADGSMVVVGAVFETERTVPVAWRIASGESEPINLLSCTCGSTEAERVVVDESGVVWVVGRTPGWRGELLVWASDDDGRTWAEPHSRLTGPEQTILAAPLPQGVAVVHWMSPFDTEFDPDALSGWTSSVYALGGRGVRLSSSSSLSLPLEESWAIDLTWINGRLWMATGGTTAASVWSSTDGETWDTIAIPTEAFADVSFVSPIAVEPIDGAVGVVLYHGGSNGNAIQVVEFDGANFRVRPPTVEAPLYYGRYMDAWPAAGDGDRVLVLDPGWTSPPTLMRLDEQHADVVPMPEIPPERRSQRERVWALTAGVDAVVATIYRQHSTGPDVWINDPPRLMIGSGDSWAPIELPPEINNVVGVVWDGDGFLVAVAASDATLFLPVSSDGVVDIETVDIGEFSAVRVFGSPDGSRLVAHTSHAKAPIWVKDHGDVWRALPRLPGTGLLVRRVCANDDLVVAVVVEGDQVTIYDYDGGATWTARGQLGSDVAGDPEDPRCEVTAGSVLVSYRDLIYAPDHFSSEWWRFGRVERVSSTGGYFDPAWPDDRITDVAQGPPGHLGIAVGLRGDDEYSYDAIAWLMPDGTTPTTAPVTLAAGPGIQEARAAVRWGDGLLVGGMDAGEAIIWSVGVDE